MVSPSIFNHIPKQQLQCLKLLQVVMLLQYMDDILLAAPVADSTMAVSEMVLSHLAACGLGVSRSKLQIERPKVTILDHLIWFSNLHMTNAQKTDILSHSKPTTVKAMMLCLELVTHSKTFEPDLSGD